MKFIAAICLSLLVACQTPVSNPVKHSPDSVVTASVAPAAPDTTTLGGPWFLQAVLASDTATGKIPNLQLDIAKSRFTGNTGCNSMRGEFWFSGNDSSLSFSDKIISTK